MALRVARVALLALVGADARRLFGAARPRPAPRGPRRLFASSALLLALAVPRTGAEDVGGVFESFVIGEDGKISKSDFIRGSFAPFAETPLSEEEAGRFEEWWSQMFDKADVDGDGRIDQAKELHYLGYLADRALLAASATLAQFEPKDEDTNIVEAMRLSEDQEPSGLLEEIDGNADGRVDKEEVLVAARDFVDLAPQEDMPEDVVEFLTSAFDKADVNNDGSLDAAEVDYMGYLIDEVMLGMDPVDIFDDEDDADFDIIPSIYRMLDANADGTVGRQELREAVHATADVVKTRDGDEIAIDGTGSAFLEHLEKHFDQVDVDGDEGVSMDEFGQYFVEYGAEL